MKTTVLFGFAVIVSCLAGSAAAAEPTPPHTSFTIHSKVLGETRVINVYTLPGYDTHANRRHFAEQRPTNGEYRT